MAGTKAVSALHSRPNVQPLPPRAFDGGTSEVPPPFSGSVAASTLPRRFPLLLTVPETADLLRTTPTAVYAMAARGQLPGATRIRRRLLVRSDLLLEWLDQNRASSARSQR